MPLWVEKRGVKYPLISKEINGKLIDTTDTYNSNTHTVSPLKFIFTIKLRLQPRSLFITHTYTGPKAMAESFMNCHLYLDWGSFKKALPCTSLIMLQIQFLKQHELCGRNI